MHDAVAGADDKTAHGVPGETDTRLKLMLGWIQRGVRCATYAELVPVRNATGIFPAVQNRARIKECISVMGLVERLVILPPQTGVQRQFWRQLDVILHKQ